MNLRILIVTIMLEHLNSCSVLNKRYWLELESQSLLCFFNFISTFKVLERGVFETHTSVRGSSASSCHLIGYLLQLAAFSGALLR